jgi:hypothetical protein
MMNTSGYLTKESLFARYVQLPQDRLLDAIAQDIDKHVSTVAGCAWFLHQDLSTQKQTLDEKQDLTERVMKASIAISAILEAGLECQKLNKSRENSRNHTEAG